MASTIKDVAKLANVSVATVSLVLHNHQRISSETNDRVKKAIKELNYHPSRSARGLVSKKTGNIGFILTEDHFLRSEPFYTRIFLGTEFEARDNGLYILLTTISTDYRSSDSLPRYVLERNVDAIIIAGKIPDALLFNLKKCDIPITFVDYYIPSEKYSVVLIDNVNGGRLAAQHLIDYGHKNIAFIGGDISHPSIYDRLQGYRMAVEKACITYDEKLCITDEIYTARENGYSAAKKLFGRTKNVTGIFACNDAMAIGVMQYLKDNSYKVPDDISLIGFDDVEADLSLDPPLSTIAVPKIEMGIEVVRLITDILKNNTKTIKKILVPVELVVRKSTKKIK